jgi:hypothetical protein
VSWDNGKPVAVDLYYDPVVNEHVGHGPIGIMAPAWYFAPQKPDVARAGWQIAATLSGALADGPVTGLEDPARATMLLQIAGEFADEATKQRIWEAAEAHIEPLWDHGLGEFTLGFGLNEEHPRGQWNARCMAGWVCEEGAWARIFNEPDLGKFDLPTVEGVDFPRVALSEARWDGNALHVAAQPQNALVHGTTTTVRITNLPTAAGWVIHRPGAEPVELASREGQLSVELTLDNRICVIRRG